MSSPLAINHGRMDHAAFRLCGAGPTHDVTDRRCHVPLSDMLCNPHAAVNAGVGVRGHGMRDVDVLGSLNSILIHV